MERTLCSLATLASIVAATGGVSLGAQVSAELRPPAGMVLIPAGEFWMGRTHVNSVEQFIILERDRRDDQPAHRVYLDAFHMDVHEVTNQEYARFVQASNAATPWHWPKGQFLESEARYPVHDVNWAEADAYCRWAGKRLPTEAEWEGAARGGLDRKRYPWGDDGGRNRAHTGSPAGPTEVASYPPNGYGLYDMMGNLWEWTNDWYERDYYTVTPDHNPKGPESGAYRVVRGGSWTDGNTMASFRNYADPEMRTPIIGFRCARSIAATP